MLLHYDYTTNVSFCPSIGRHNILLRCLPAREAFQQSVCEDFFITQCFWYNENIDGFGNRIICGGTTERHNILEYHCRGTVDYSTYCIPDSHPHPMYSLLPSVALAELLRNAFPHLAEEARWLGGLDGALHIMHKVHEYMEYRPLVTDINTTVADVVRMKQGVCQDYAQLMTQLCRLAGYPSRYVCGLIQGEGATHAWVEIHDGQCWYAFDPTNDTAIAQGFIKLAHGRDASDCPVSRGTYLGVTLETMEVNIKVQEEENIDNQ